MARSTARLGTPPFETLIWTMMPVVVDMSVASLPKFGDDGVDVEDAQRLEDGSGQRLRGSGRAGRCSECRHELGDGPPTIAQLDQPLNQRADLDALGAMWRAEHSAPREGSLGQHGLLLHPRSLRQHGHEITRL